MNYFLTSDTHFGHANIIKYCNRPFKDVEEMNSTIIRKFNERVKEDDICYFLGDFCFRGNNVHGNGSRAKFADYRNKLNCKNIIFIRGNHDKNNDVKNLMFGCMIHYATKSYMCMHNPEHAIAYAYDVNFVGHVHDKWTFRRFVTQFDIKDCINVGVDAWNFYPVRIEEALSKYRSWQKGHNTEREA